MWRLLLTNWRRMDSLPIVHISKMTISLTGLITLNSLKWSDMT